MSLRQPIDPELARYLAGLTAVMAAAPAPATNEDAVRLARAGMVRALETRESIPGLPNKVETRDMEIGFGLKARLYVPPGNAGPPPVLVYLHGGGWVIGSITTHDPFCRLLCQASGVIIASVEYRLAPEHPHPAAVNDTLAAVDWAAKSAKDLGGDAARLALGGDSAGANLAAVAANRLCGATEAPPLRALLLLYPATDHPGADHPSYQENATGYALEAERMRWYWQQYAPGVSRDDPDAFPLRVERVPALPPTLIATAEYDVLRDEGLAYGQKLKAAGVAVTQIHAPDMHHNFPVHPATVGRFPPCHTALAEIAGWLRVTLAPVQPG